MHTKLNLDHRNILFWAKITVTLAVMNHNTPRVYIRINIVDRFFRREVNNFDRAACPWNSILNALVLPMALFIDFIVQIVEQL